MNDPPEHDTGLPKFLRESAGIDTGNPGYSVMHHPLMKRAHRVEVTEVATFVLADDGADVDLFTLKILAEAPLVLGFARNAIVADEWKRKREDLAAVTRVSHGLRVPDHAGIEDHFAIGIGFRAERLAFEDRAVSENEGSQIDGMVAKAS